MDAGIFIVLFQNNLCGLIVLLDAKFSIEFLF